MTTKGASSSFPLRWVNVTRGCLMVAWLCVDALNIPTRNSVGISSFATSGWKTTTMYARRNSFDDDDFGDDEDENRLLLGKD